MRLYVLQARSRRRGSVAPKIAHTERVFCVGLSDAEERAVNRAVSAGDLCRISETDATNGEVRPKPITHSLTPIEPHLRVVGSFS